MAVLSSDQTNQRQPLIIAVIPAYNESTNIGSVIAATSKFVNSIIVVDDGSIDKTKDVATTLNAIVIRNKRNMGKGFALKRGIIECLKYNPDVIITIDADGQHDPSDIPKLLEPIKSEDADVVIGSRYVKEALSDAPLYRKLGLNLLNSINSFIVKSSVKDGNSGFRAYSKDVLSTILKYDSVGYGVEVEQLAALEGAGFRIIEVPITVKYKGLINTSKQGPFSQGVHILSTLIRIAVERKPLSFFGLGGLVLLAISLVPTFQVLQIFNETRYFSLPLALVAIGFGFIGSMLILMSFVFFALKRIRQREEIIGTTLLDLLNRMKK
jgi:glycosyltransferase involved in cell wall biosynthesis